MTSAMITSKHQITIPKSVRQKLNLREGDRVEFSESNSNQVVLIKSRPPNKSDGIAKQFMKSKKVLTVGEMKAAARSAASKKFSSLNS